MPSNSIRMPADHNATIIFDLDGTLVDTAPDLASAMNAVLRHFGRPPVETDAVRDMVGHGARRTMAKGLALTGGGTEAMLDEGLPLFLEHYAEHICDGSRPWEGVEAALDTLAADCHLTICTNKPEALAVKLVAALGWSDRFAAVLGGDTLPVRKPHPEHVFGALEAVGGRADRACFVGDSRVDLEAARAAGVPIVLVSFGYSDVPPCDLPADACIQSFDALIPAIRACAPGIF